MATRDDYVKQPIEARARRPSVIETTVVGSYPQPDWLVDKTRYRQTVVPRIRMPELWRVPAAHLDEAQDDAVRLAVGDMVAAGVDVVTDGEQRRESDWIQLDEPYLEARADHAKAYALPAIDRALAGLRKPTCIHVCFGYAFSHALAGTSKSGGYRFALELERSAATHLSLEAAQPGLDLSALAAIRGKTVVLGVLDLGDPTPESADVVAARLREALRHVPAERLVAAPDCGMKYLDRPSARARLRALVEGARRV